MSFIKYGYFTLIYVKIKRIFNIFIGLGTLLILSNSLFIKSSFITVIPF